MTISINEWQGAVCEAEKQYGKKTIRVQSDLETLATMFRIICLSADDMDIPMEKVAEKAVQLFLEQ